MELKKLFSKIKYKLVYDSNSDFKNIDIDDLKYDSRNIKPGDLFIAITGFETDGHKYIGQAIENGAAAVLIEKPLTNYQEGIIYLQVENSRRVMALLARNFFQNPLSEIDLIGITGTNGKTTTALLLYNVLKSQTGKAALFGTIKNIVGEKIVDSKRTTPESLDLYRYFSTMRSKGIKYGVMEVSSHALDLYRVYGMDFSAAIFTNLTAEHLDYHKSMTNYRNIKSQLFSSLNSDSFAIINQDDPSSDLMADKSTGKNYFYSLTSEKSDLYAKNHSLNSAGISFRTTGRIKEEFDLNLGGIFNIYNSLSVILTADLLGIKKENIKTSLNAIKGIPGRFEIINEGQDFQIVVDYAHTPDAMKNILETAAEMKKNRLIVLFGCGGDRDRQKRPKMAELAEKYADYVIISDDNPRSENPDQIFSEIENGFSNDFSDYKIISDRKKAIIEVVKMAEQDDLLLILGRGHEQYQVLKNKTIELDDRKIARKAVKSRKESV